jgi:threonine synthase
LAEERAGEQNPFVVNRRHLDVYRHARQRGLSDAAYVELVVAADRRVAEVEGHGFRITPLVELDLPAEAGVAGRVLAKVETGNVARSHKARHLFGVLLRSQVDRAAAGTAAGPVADLAIASCGNAALGAAVVAASAGRRLLVFVPFDADPAIVDRLVALGADVEACRRQPGRAGDPCVERLGEALDAGAEPFTVQGPVCPASIDGGRTIGLELADQLDQAGVARTEVSDLYIQIGGGALATAVADGLQRRWGPDAPPRLHPVQAVAVQPYVEGWKRIVAALLDQLGLPDPIDDRRRAADLARSAGRLRLPDDLERWAGMMTPWPVPPHSVASGIIDDLPYDWRTVMSHQIVSGGWPVAVPEATLLAAAGLAGALVTPPPDPTGAAGLAGLLTDSGRPAGQRCSVVLLTGSAQTGSA